MPKLNVAQARLPATEISVEHVETLDAVTAQLHVGDVAYIFENEPRAIAFDDASKVVTDQAIALARVSPAVGVAVLRAWRTTNHAVEAPGHDVEIFHVSIPEKIGTENDAVTGRGKSAAEQIDAGEK